MKTLLITPPLLQPNTPYAATPILTAWLRSQGQEAVQADLSLELLLKLFSAAGLAPLDFDEEYRAVIDEVMEFLQDRNPSAAKRFAKRGALPEGPHVLRAWAQEKQFGWNFRGLDRHDRARHLCSLFLDDVAEAAARIDPYFGFSRYAESLAATLPRFGKLREVLEHSASQRSFFFQTLEKLTDEQVEKHDPQLVAITVPFPGCLFGALAIARRIKQTCPEIKIVLGGGYANTELRELTDPEIFDFVDYIVLDSGMLPLLRIAEGAEPSGLVRTFVREDGSVRFYDCAEPPIAHDTLPPPVYDGLPMGSYVGLFEVLNPLTRLWSDGRWNKLVLAHGCCWSRCAFCDTSIDYICRYDPARPSTVCDWMEAIMESTGFNGFHFVDEALPPALIDGLCDEILRRGLQVEWWGNIRFEKRLTQELIGKMAAAGCIAVTGGLETCCDRTLGLMKKGITVESAERVLADFADAGIMTHAYLMYGFPTQTREETFQSLETVRRLMDEGVLHSAFWHRFALTAHSEIARDPERFGITLLAEEPGGFARNEIPFDGHFETDLDALGEALRAATYNYQHGAGFEVPVEDWL
ncbi:MAG: radical SAM protein [Verrucomicrobia bacterium]|nr:radical SAM protein [Verrucomicrobiota bacterium]